MKRMISLKLLIFLAVLLPSHVRADQEEDFTLSRVIEIALEKNNQQRALASEIEARGYAYQASRRLFNPSLEYELGNAVSYDGTEERNTGGVWLSQYLENPLKRLYRIRMSESEWLASRFAFGSLSLDVIFEVKRNFYTILMLGEKEGLAERNLESLEQALSLVETRVRLGETRELEADELALHTKAIQDHPLIGQSQANLSAALNNVSYFRSSRIPDPVLSGFMEDELDGRNRGIGISETSYREGEISLIEYLDSQRTFYSIQNEYHDALYEWNLGRAALENAIGADLE